MFASIEAFTRSYEYVSLEVDLVAFVLRVIIAMNEDEEKLSTSTLKEKGEKIYQGSSKSRVFAKNSFKYFVVVCGSYLSKKTYGEKWANVGAKAFAIQACTSFVVRRMIGWGLPPAVRFKGIFGISFLRFSINTLFYVTLILT